MATGNWTEADVMAHNARIGRSRGEVVHTAQTLALEAPPEKRQKFGNKKTVVDGIVFDSGHEADRYLELKLLEAAGEIRNLDLQPKFGIFACELASGKGIEVASFKADFRYVDVKQNRTRIEDAKSEGTKGETAYRLRKKLVEACHSIEIEEV